MMELTDSSETAGGNASGGARSPLGIDLNEIPSTSSPPLTQQQFNPSDPDSFDVVQAILDNPDPAPGIPAAIPGEEDRGAAACGSCGKPEVRGHVMLCDGCERGFHLACAGMRDRQAMNLDDWICGDCSLSGVKSKLWPLGVKSKQILDINASPPSDADADRDTTEEVLDFRRPPVTYSNVLQAGNGFGGLRGSSGVMMHALRVGLGDILNPTESGNGNGNGGFDDVDLDMPIGRLRSSSNKGSARLPAQNPSEMFLQGLREFISERNGVLEEGWHVEVKHSVGDYEVYVVYCSPDGKTFGSMSEVACHLGLMPNGNSMDADAGNSRLPSMHESLHLPKKRKSKRYFIANGFVETRETWVNGSQNELITYGRSKEAGDAKFGNSTGAEMEEDCIVNSQPSTEGLPVQFEDFFILSLGKIDVRPSYHDVSLIWPVGYRSCWHDKVTGSLFICEVLDGGDSGPAFKVSRFPCSAFPVLKGSTVLCTRNLCQSARENDEETSTIAVDGMDCEEDDSIQMILADPSPPTEDDIAACLPNGASEIYGVQASECLHTISSHGSSRNLVSDDVGLEGEIGNISVEERSLCSAWRMVTQKLIDGYSNIFKQRGALKFSCNHAENEMTSTILGGKNQKCEVSFESLAKFCSSPSLVSIPLEYQGEADTLASALLNWLDQDRFGLDAQFVQEIIEKLPGIEACSKYEFLVNRGDYSASITVGNGVLTAKRKGEIAVDDSFQQSKRPRLDPARDDFPLPAGRLLTFKLPPVLAGDFYQVCELLWRFYEVLSLDEPFLLEKLEEELINPWCDDSNLVDLENVNMKNHGSQASHAQKLDGVNGQVPFLGNESDMAVHGEKSHTLISVETGKDVGQSTFASVTNFNCCGVTLTKMHSSLLFVLISELQAKVAALVDPNFDSGEFKSKRGRRKDADISVPVRKSKVYTLPINELTWPELARRYILAVLSMDDNLDSAEIITRESGKVFRCLQGDGGVLCGALTGVVGLEADALLLAEARMRVFGSLSGEKDVLIMEDETTDASGSCDNNNNNENDIEIPDWAKVLEPVRKLPTNVGTRIRKCVYEALDKCPPEWAKKRLEHSISKEVYKGNASGPTKKAVLSVLADVRSQVLAQKAEKKNKRKITVRISDIVMKQCRIVFRRAAAADDAKVFCTLLGRCLINSCDNDDEGLLGTPAMVSRPLDFRTIDLRLAAGAYGGSHESFLEDVQELWNSICAAFADQPDLVELAETLSQNFEAMYEKEVVNLAEKLEGFAKLDHISAEMKKEIDDILAYTNEIPKAPWEEGVCKVCGVDRDDVSVLLCDTCDAEYHTYCLSPPLARIPEGNWYCPSCAVGAHKVEEVSQNALVIGRGCSKRYQGELTRIHLDRLARLADILEKKEYWEFSVDERLFLLKFLCDELLNSTLIRQHIEQCTEIIAELQQKLRSYSMEWRNLRSRDDFQASRATKIDSKVGEVGLNEGPVSVLINQDKCVGQLCELSGSHSGTLSEDLPEQEVGKEGLGVNSFDKDPSATNPQENNSQHNQSVKTVDTEGQSSDPQAVSDDDNVTTEENDKSTSLDQLPFSNHLPQGTVSMSVKLPVTLNESQACHTELSGTENDALRIQSLITITEAQLLKLSLRREFLGTDSRGRLYWASAASGRHLGVIVDGSLTVLQNPDYRGLLDNGSVLQNFATGAPFYLEGSKGCFPFVHVPADAMCTRSPLVSYETEAEIKELICWLKDDDSKERELKDSILHLLKQRLLETHETRNLVEGGHQKDSLLFVKNDEPAFASGLVTKAAVLLEDRYGTCIELDTAEVLKRWGKRARVTGEEKMYRCDCLEPIWLSRHHCLNCHRTFSSDAEFEAHDSGRCNAVSLAHEKGEEISSYSNGKVNKISEMKHKGSKGEMGMAETSKSGWSELSSRVIKFQNEGTDCPYNLEDIRPRFLIGDSNKELVQEIGLIGSDGIPSFVTSISPYLNESTIMLIPPQKDDGVLGNKSNIDERLVFSGGNKTVTAGGLSVSDDSWRKHGTGKVSEVLRTNKQPSRCLERRETRTSSDRRFYEMGYSHCCVVPQSSLRPLIGKVLHILGQLKINLLDMEAGLPEEAIRPSMRPSRRRWAWRSFVKSAESIYEMVQATIILEEMIKTEYLRNEWWYWSSLSAAARTSTITSLALRIYSLDAAIVYDKASNSNPSSSLRASNLLEQKSVPTLDPVDKCRVNRKSNKKRKEVEG